MPTQPPGDLRIALTNRDPHRDLDPLLDTEPKPESHRRRSRRNTTSHRAGGPSSPNTPPPPRSPAATSHPPTAPQSTAIPRQHPPIRLSFAITRPITETREHHGVAMTGRTHLVLEIVIRTRSRACQRESGQPRLGSRPRRPALRADVREFGIEDVATLRTVERQHDATLAVLNEERLPRGAGTWLICEQSLGARGDLMRAAPELQKDIVLPMGGRRTAMIAARRPRRLGTTPTPQFVGFCVTRASVMISTAS